MCGGAILSDIIAPTANRSRRLTAHLLWNPSADYSSKPISTPSIDIDDDFEADFQGFKDQHDHLPYPSSFAFSASKPIPKHTSPAPGIFTFFFFYAWLFLKPY